MNTVIWWIRRDVRLTDNPALTAALEAAEQVLPVFILDEKLLKSPYNSRQRTAFLLGGLRELDNGL
jgi:deoxyribodipyrimidine photo-lyase